MSKIKESFEKVKKDIFSIGEEIQQLKIEIIDLKNEIKLISDFIDDLRQKLPEIQEKTTPTQLQETPTDRQITPTHPKIPTDNLLSQVLKRQNLDISTGNQGVPTDRQTNRQTDIPTHKPIKQDKLNHLEKAAEILNSLDGLKKEIRRKFKALTSQETAVFSLIYQLESQGEIVDYPLLSSKLNLSEGSIRDYIFKIKKKGIPIIKEKLNNKRVILHISPDLKKIASLDTILKLREL